MYKQNETADDLKKRIAQVNRLLTVGWYINVTLELNSWVLAIARLVGWLD